MTVMGKSQKSIQNLRKSKSQNKKIKLGKKGKQEFTSTGKRGRLIIRNLPFKCNENELHKHFKPFGEIKDIKLLRRPDNKLVGCGFIEFVSRLNADKAVVQLNGKPFLGRPIYVERAVARERYNNTDHAQLLKDMDKKNTTEQSEGNNVSNELEESEIKEELGSDDEGSLDVTPAVKQEVISSDSEEIETEYESKNDVHSKKVNETNSKIKKRARLIVRNLSFKSTEEKLKNHFVRFGEITEVKLLRRPDDTLVGCGFVQFTKKQSAAKAIHHTSGKHFLDRPIIVDWAVAKDRFKQMQEEAIKKEVKKEEASDDETKPVNVSSISVKKEEEQSDGELEESEEESKTSDNAEDNEENDADEEEEYEDDESNEDFKPNIKHEDESFKKQRHEDIDEGKTVFVKNLPFSATDPEFKECMKQFGPVYYALICKDKLTEHSKGSGFVKFKSKEDAEKCLGAGTELTLNGTILDPHPALKRSEAQNLKEKSKDKKDNRNLYLVKEGMIIAGTVAAKGVSVTDMERRLQLEQWKTTKLRNLNMFVSWNRLVVHNLPPTFSDKQLRNLFHSHAGPKALIKEARIMRDLKNVDGKGKGVSKGYGFVSFEQHEDALKALRNINNNPNIFTPAKRPIVAFSIENRSVLNTKTKRMVRSRQKNPMCKDYKPEETEIAVKKSKHRNNDEGKKHNEPQYVGIVAKPGATVKMRQKYKLQNQAQQHVHDVKKQKREMKMSRKIRRSEHLKQKQVEKKSAKKRKHVDVKDTAFTNLVDKYKTTILSQNNKKKKWYEGE